VTADSPCPRWCSLPAALHPWITDGDEQERVHTSADLARPTRSGGRPRYALVLTATDVRGNGVELLDPGSLALELDEIVLRVEDAQALAADLTAASALLARGR
jgi:hypothetical protein